MGCKGKGRIGNEYCSCCPQRVHFKCHSARSLLLLGLLGGGQGRPWGEWVGIHSGKMDQMILPVWLGLACLCWNKCSKAGIPHKWP